MAPHRRGFMRALAALPGFGLFINWLSPAVAAPQPRDYYKELGLRPVVNAAGTYTFLGGSLMPPEVIEARNIAARQFVNLIELHEAAGKRIASLIGCEAALVTSGAAAALTLATAACVAGKDEAKIIRLPDTTGCKNEVIIQKTHRYGYDHAVRNVGIRFVEVETRQELEKAVSDRTAMMLFFNNNDPVGQIKVEEFAQLGKKLKVPTLNDAAADVPPVENLTRYLKMGFDLVCFSGGKAMHGPQSAGLLLGRKALIEAAMLNNNPNTDSIGRTNKVDKEDIIGMLAAVEHFLKQDHAALWGEYEKRVQTIADAVTGLATVKTQKFVPPIANHVPHLRIRWDASKRSPSEIVKQLRDGDPRIEIREELKDGIEVSVWMLEPAQAEIVARRLREVLGKL
jgi:D-glucosaminate-6-phosphate ammonia-lyase